MHVQIVAKHLADMERELLEDYFKLKRPRIEKLTSPHFDEDTVKMDVVAEKFTKNDAFKVEFVMELPKAGKKTLVVSEDSRDLRKAIDLCTDKMVRVVKKELERLNHEHQRAT